MFVYRQLQGKIPLYRTTLAERTHDHVRYPDHLGGVTDGSPTYFQHELQATKMGKPLGQACANGTTPRYEKCDTHACV